METVVCTEGVGRKTEMVSFSRRLSALPASFHDLMFATQQQAFYIPKPQTDEQASEREDRHLSTRHGV